MPRKKMSKISPQEIQAQWEFRMVLIVCGTGLVALGLIMFGVYKLLF